MRKRERQKSNRLNRQNSNFASAAKRVRWLTFDKVNEFWIETTQSHFLSNVLVAAAVVVKRP